jgi:hypothetical protein
VTLRYIRNEIELHILTDWPIWAVLATGMLVGGYVGLHDNWARGLLAGCGVIGWLTLGLLGAYGAGRREAKR